jgi:hypothetical protein
LLSKCFARKAKSPCRLKQGLLAKGERYFLCGCGQALSGKGPANAGSPPRQNNPIPPIFFMLFIFMLFIKVNPIIKLLSRPYLALAFGSPT